LPLSQFICEKATKTVQGAKVAHLDGSFTNPEGRRDVGVRETLQVAQHEYLPIARAQLSQSSLYPVGRLLPQELAVWTGTGSDQPLGQLEGRFVGESQSAGFLADDAAAPGVDVTPVQEDQPFPRQAPQPGVEGERSPPQVLGQLARSVGQGLLHDVRGIDSRCQPTVHAYLNHPAQPIPMPHQELFSCRGVATAGLLDQVVRVGVRRYDARALL
jgi:hypothetical protein